MNLLFLKMKKVKIKMEIDEIMNKLKEIEDMVNTFFNKNNMEVKKVKDTIQNYLSTIVDKQSFGVYISFKSCIIHIYYPDISMSILRRIIDILSPFKYYFDTIDWRDRFCYIKFIKGE